MEYFGIFLLTLLGCYISRTWGEPFNNYLESSRDTVAQNAELNYRQTNQNKTSTSCGKNSSIFCSPWSYCGRDGTCKCPEIPNSVLYCDEFGQMKGILTCNCITYNQNTSTLEIGLCLYNCYAEKKSSSPYRSLPSNMSEWNELLCGRFNRAGTLCGQCKEGHYISAYSYDLTCIKCSDGASNWWKLVFMAFLPLTIFYIVVLVFRINIHSTYLQGYVLYSQAITIIPLARNIVLTANTNPVWLKYAIYSMGTFCGVWNLDFFRFFNPGICLQTGSLTTISLDLLVAVYPFLLILITYAMIHAYDRKVGIFVAAWKPFKDFFGLFEKTWDFKSSLIDAFSTFFFLLGMKCVDVCGDFLIPVKIYLAFNKHIHSEYRLYYDASIPYFGRQHLPFGILALVVMSAVGILPTLLFLLYPYKLFQKFINCFVPQSWKIYLHTFVDTIQGCYKDGTKLGTWDFRCFSGIVFGARIFFMVVYGLTLNATFFIAIAGILVLFVIAFIIADPYKARFNGLSAYFIIFIIFIASICVVSNINSYDFFLTAISYLLIDLLTVMPIIYIVVLIVLWIIRHNKTGWKLLAWLKSKITRS